MGTAFSDAAFSGAGLIKLAYAFEQTSYKREQQFD